MIFASSNACYKQLVHNTVNNFTEVRTEVDPPCTVYVYVWS